MRVGIVGIGWWSDVLAGVIAKTEKLELRACYTRSEDKAAKFAAEFGCEAMPSYEAMLALDDLDGVILTTPNSAHLPGTKAAAAAGKHVFVEKPVSNSIADGRAMIAACEAAGVVLAVGHSYRRNGALRHLKHLIDSGDLGRISLAEGVFSNDNGLKLKPGVWRTDPAEIPGGCLMQIGIHQIDNLLYLLGDAGEVTAYFNRLETEPEIEDVTALLMQFKSGAVGYVAADYISPRRFTLAIHGTKANAFFDMDNDGLRIQRTGDAAPSPVEYAPADHLLVELEDFADAATEGRKPEIDGRDGLLPLAVVLAAAKSSNERRSIPLAEILGDD
ncbi:MAG: Gfo/Idh/MocA family oxidoreductase [Rhodospirillaceae bacterium]|jgi:predicted dehydrogenase|nr:Gfo/Idh/MocA family oxidoreductase [Rhodospirillaceae bacterium]MBT5943207.1 Gfo/Idh/MocA family oxidoreductase [Rhodospirillaceae bacterium]MBT6405545.1 Gfo/Idh/MocA family oxidoreductase [Rhodospirillaceae bacterium]MBT6535394.1 Gfo/Idh/MocA family oxidoreductase [Rhodospirillaceae bacterium]MBT7362215.1 Gfo/Idh/MocA family oxidoreductase [Rhodospirillaceae bacterium]